MADLSSIFGPLGNLSSIMDEEDRVSAAKNVKDYGSLQDIMQAEEMNPLKLQQQGLVNAQYQAQIPGIAARSDADVRANDIGRATHWDTLDEAQKSHALTAKKQDLDLLLASAKQQSLSTDPNVRKQGQQLMDLWNGITEKMALQKQKGQDALAVQSLRNSKPTAVRGGGRAGGGGGGATPKTLQAALVKAIADGDTEKAKFYQDQLAYQRQVGGKPQVDASQYGVKYQPAPQAPAIPRKGASADPYAGFSITKK